MGIRRSFCQWSVLGVLLLGGVTAAVGAGCVRAPEVERAGEIAAKRLPPNFHAVSGELFRSGQPEVGDYPGLAGQGVKSILNLRDSHVDAPDGRFQLLLVPMNAGSLTQEQLVHALQEFQRAEKPMLVHCWHGSDRTGAFCAAYRIVFQEWSVEAAIAEMEESEYGFHGFWYGNIPRLLRGIDWAQVRNQVRGE